MGGSDGAARNPGAYIVPARRALLGLPVANDNKPPFSQRLRRLFAIVLILALIAGIVLI